MIRFSILVPTRDRAELAGACVRAILAQRGAPAFEILVVDQSADDATGVALARAVADAGPGRAVFLEDAAKPSSEDGNTTGATRVVRIVSRETGRSRALNAGWPRARGAWVAILDDDCEPETDWLAWLDAEVKRAGPRDVVVGRVMPGPIEPGKAVPPATIVDPLPADYAGRVDRDLVYPNIALPRHALSEVGPFDVRLGVGTSLPGGEDNDFGYRLLRAGWRILYRPTPTVVHRAWRSEAERAALKRSYGIGQGAFYAKHLAGADLFIAYRFARDVLRTARAAAGATRRGWWPQSRGHLAFLGGLFTGAWRMSVLMARTGRAPSAPVSGGRMIEIELTSGTVAPPELGDAALAYVLFRWKGRPVGRLLLEPGHAMSPQELRTSAFETSAPGILAVEIETSGEAATGPDHGAALLQRLAELTDIPQDLGPAGPRAVPRAETEADAQGARHLSKIPDATEVSVVIATRDRPEDLAACLAALRALPAPPGELVVADSASRDAAAVATLARAAGARLVRLEKAGLSRARNAGAAAATGSVLAFLDDDCRVDAGWLESLRGGFTDDDVGAVTGLLLPLEIEAEAQRLFLHYSHMDRRGFLPRRYDRAARPSRHWPIDAWRMGSGGNLAVRASRFARLGGFHPALGLGTPARGGEDLFLLWSIVREGGAVVFRPGAMARHRHHRTRGALEGVLYGYGAGHAAYLRAAVAAGAPPADVRFYKMSYYADRAVRLGRSLLGRWPVPAGLVLREVRGSLAGGRLARRAEREAAEEAANAARATEAAQKPTS